MIQAEAENIIEKENSTFFVFFHFLCWLQFVVLDQFVVKGEEARGRRFQVHGWVVV